jgi:hypothetical protein
MKIATEPHALGGNPQGLRHAVTPLAIGDDQDRAQALDVGQLAQRLGGVELTFDFLPTAPGD